MNRLLKESDDLKQEWTQPDEWTEPENGQKYVLKRKKIWICFKPTALSVTLRAIRTFLIAQYSYSLHTDCLCKANIYKMGISTMYGSTGSWLPVLLKALRLRLISHLAHLLFQLNLGPQQCMCMSLCLVSVIVFFKPVYNCFPTIQKFTLYCLLFQTIREYHWYNYHNSMVII